MDAPLAELLAEFRVDVSELAIEDTTFTGGAYVRPDGTMLFAMRQGQPAAEREMIARAMLGRALRVPMPPLPDLYELTELEPLESSPA
ncbi:hypothetical protein [Streptomyces sp. NPDC020377]|uniref:hypothetical protein n=1 Tax=Streptomyces sp. NPDC020377 TaxID=3365070 RepID=UPI0037B2054B